MILLLLKLFLRVKMFDRIVDSESDDDSDDNYLYIFK